MTAAAGGAFLATLRLAPVEIEALETPARPVTASPRSSTSLLSRPAALTFAVRRADNMSINGTGGVVTGLAIGEGARVAEGDLVVRLNNTWVVAMRSTFPQWRVLSRGARGTDVESLQGFLKHNLAPGLDVDGEYGDSTVAAVKLLEELIGIEKPAGVSDPSYYAWMPTESFLVGKPAIAEGDVIQSGSVVIALSQTAVTRQEILAPGLAWDSKLKYVLTLESGSTVDLVADESGSLNAEDSQLLGLTEVEEALAHAGTETVELELQGSAQLVGPLEVQEIAPSAVAQGADGATCVWIREAGQWTPTIVDILAFSPNGTPQVPAGSLPSDTDVLVNPNQVLADSRCPSA